MSYLQALIKKHNDKSVAQVTPIHLSFGDDMGGEEEKAVDDNAGGPGDEDMQKPFKEVLRSSFTQKIIEFLAPKHLMPTNMRIYDGSINLDDHVTRFFRAANWGEWQMHAKLCEKFSSSCALKRRCFKDPTEFSKIMRRANEILPDFKERWTDEMSYIQDVPKGEGALNQRLLLVEKVIRNGGRIWQAYPSSKDFRPSGNSRGKQQGNNNGKGKCKSCLSIALTISAPPSTMMKFIVVRAASPYNIILGRTGIKKLRLKEKQMLEEEKAMEERREKRKGSLVE
ncbi:hypothetical protein Tco_0883596 [Tanacetum coccineum]